MVKTKTRKKPVRKTVAKTSSEKPAFQAVDQQPVLRTQCNGIELAYQDYGSPKDPAVVLIVGLGCQLVHWPDEVVQALVNQGLRVIRFDNRDVGESTYIQKKKPLVPMILRIILARFGIRVKAPYALEDMAADTFGLMDALQIEKAHLVGFSMGGMISQCMSISRPERVLSLTSIMSTSGATRLPAGDREVIRALITLQPTGEREQAIANMMQLWELLGGTRYPQDPERMRKIINMAIERTEDPTGFQRQVMAIVSATPRTKSLGSLKMPAMIVHGTADPLVKPECGKHTAACIPGSRLEMIEGMGHALQPAVVDLVIPLLQEHIAAA